MRELLRLADGRRRSFFMRVYNPHAENFRLHASLINLANAPIKWTNAPRQLFCTTCEVLGLAPVTTKEGVGHIDSRVRDHRAARCSRHRRRHCRPGRQPARQAERESATGEVWAAFGLRRRAATRREPPNNLRPSCRRHPHRSSTSGSSTRPPPRRLRRQCRR